MTKLNQPKNDYLQETTDLTPAKENLDEFGCCIPENALSQDEITALRTHLECFGCGGWALKELINLLKIENKI